MNNANKPDPKIGAGHVEAMFRQGLKEARNALYPESPIAQQPEYGIYGTRTPGEIAEARRTDSLEAHLQEANSRDVSGRDNRDLERE